MKNYLQKKLWAISKWPLFFLCIIYLIFFIENQYQLNFSKYGVLPRTSNGLIGILTSVFIHGDSNHILGNSLPLLVLGMLTFFFYKKIAKQSLFWIWIISGIWLWIGGRNDEQHATYHIGASTLIYGMASFLFFSGLFRRHLRLMVVSALVVFLYGSITWGMFPIDKSMSWEGHLFGALAGILVAYSYRKEGPKRSTYYWSEEEENELEKTSYWKTPKQLINDESKTINVNYIYKPTSEKDSEKL